MTSTDIIRMARETFDVTTDGRGRETFSGDSFGIERFAALVAAAERKRFAWTQEHWTEYERNITAAAKAEEREACAKLADDIDPVWESVSVAIRERSLNARARAVGGRAYDRYEGETK